MKCSQDFPVNNNQIVVQEGMLKECLEKGKDLQDRRQYAKRFHD